MNGRSTRRLYRIDRHDEKLGTIRRFRCALWRCYSWCDDASAAAAAAAAAAPDADADADGVRPLFSKAVVCLCLLRPPRGLGRICVRAIIERTVLNGFTIGFQTYNPPTVVYLGGRINNNSKGMLMGFLVTNDYKYGDWRSASTDFTSVPGMPPCSQTRRVYNK